MILLAVYRSYFLLSRQISCLLFFTKRITAWNLNVKFVWDENLQIRMLKPCLYRIVELNALYLICEFFFFRCGGDGQMKCDPKVCSPEPMLRKMIMAAATRRRWSWAVVNSVCVLNALPTGENICFFSDYKHCISHVVVMKAINPSPALHGLSWAVYEQFAKCSVNGHAACQ